MNNTIFVKRKCACCKDSVCISNNNISEVIYYDKKTYHSKCFLSICEKGIKSNRQDVLAKWTKAFNNMAEIKNQSYSHFIQAITKEEIFEFIKETYSVSIVPSPVWHKLASIYDGTFKGMSEGIPPEHLLDMWRRKIKMLNDIAHNNQLKGKKMTGQQRINYDLSVLINKYDSYLGWLERQKILASQNNVVDNDISMTKYIGQNAKQHLKQPSKNDISDLVNDIFG